ncbi:DNA protecting protein DprA [uncultured delta proteobacterium]|uniref:DNA protecting protein DprA n=1 Tax=uncultured delta proteobacterium TaxID=34034 RepID=A0A212IV16_9DELT|nr:DNA protecting protein DprA [uncultured delta proteobacterium]
MIAATARAYSLTCRDGAAKQEYWSCLALRECPNIGMRRITALLSHFGSAYDAVRCPDAWADAGIPEHCAASFKKETWRQKAGLEWAAAKTCPCGILLWSDAEYPAWLRSIADAPPFLYFFGDLSLLRNVAVAVVGMRSCSEEGLKATAHIAGGLSRAGVTIVSGMAKGIDRAAHHAGLEGPGGSIGVLGAGIDVVYPQANSDLYGLMHEKGLLLSEYPPAHGAEPKNFPVRNRIISGLSRAVVVVEAAVRSGSLNTANHALEQNRELMAVPGAVSASSAKGCQELIRKGAKPVFCADDVLQEFMPLLADHVRQEVLARDLSRFCFPRPEGRKDEPAAARPSPGTSSRKAVHGGKGKPDGAKQAGPEAAGPKDAKPADGAAAGLSGLEAQVYDAVRDGPIHIDDICRALGQNAGIVSRVAAMLEIRGLLARIPGMRYKVL